MHNRDFHHEREFRTKRLAAWVCVAFALLIIIGAVTYGLRTGAGFPGNPIQISFASQNCPVPSHSSGDSTITINSGGQRRSFIVHLPPSYGQEPQPLILNYHGYDNTASYMEKYTNLGAEADKANFIAVFPQGALDNADPPKTSWNAGTGAYGPTGTADDVQFTRDMLSYLEKNYCVDTYRIYVTGYSIGASMAYRVACTLTNQIAGLATVEGAFYHFPGGCQASRSIPVLDIHSLVDPLAPYNGSASRDLFSVQTFLNLWFSVDQCNTSTSQTVFQKNDVTGTAWKNCTSGSAVEEYKITDGGHVWAGSPINRPDLGYTTHTIDANTVIWNFLSQFES